LTNVAGPGFGGEAVAESSFSEPYSGTRAIDGQVGHGGPNWFSADSTPLPCALTITLDDTYDVQAIALTQASWTGSMYHSKRVALEARVRGEWVAVGEVTLPDQSEARTMVQLDNPVHADAVRVTVLTSYVEPQTCGLAEVEVLASGVASWSVPSVRLSGDPAPKPIHGTCGLALVADGSGPQVLLSSQPSAAGLALGAGESASLDLELTNVPDGAELAVRGRLAWGGGASGYISVSGERHMMPLNSLAETTMADLPAATHVPVRLTVTAGDEPCAVELRDVALVRGGRARSIPLAPAPPVTPPLPPPIAPIPSGAMERLLIEWDWRMQDGIGTERAPASFCDAAETLIERGDRLAWRLKGESPEAAAAAASWRASRRDWHELPEGLRDGPEGEAAWLALHWSRRDLALANPLLPDAPILFAKRVPSSFSHQLTQYYGRYARPGGGLFVLPDPGRSMAANSLTEDALPLGSYLHPELSYDAERVLFAYCEAPTPPEDTLAGHAGRHYHLYEMPVAGGAPAQLTNGPFDDFSARYLPGGDLLFISTRRGGWHRCGSPGCENYTLTRSRPDGSEPRSISVHETQEWDPVVLNDGRIAYTRWDYVDRHAVFYEQLWWTLPDGSNPSALYGNNTFNPVGTWEPQPVPGSHRIMATAAAHHAMTAGSIILVDPRRGVDGPYPITRLTPGTPFPESESLVSGTWQAVAPGLAPRTSEEEQRWPGHCYRSPYPLSEDFFLAAYSFEPLIGEPSANSPSMFGLYLVDAYGNKELLYRDIAIASQWPIPVVPRLRPPTVGETAEGGGDGAFLIQNINESSVDLPQERIAAVRVIQLVPKSTPGANNPKVGLANASPGKQVLGTTPVADDGSAYFRAPAGVPLAFQALDQDGKAIQTMRSVTYLQPGQTLSCVGCHEERTTAPGNGPVAAAEAPPADLEPGPDGSNPLSYPILVQPVLDRACLDCHGSEDPAGGVRLTGDPEGTFTVSYNQLAPKVSFAEWKGGPDFAALNSEPLATPDFFGARGSELWRMLEEGHHGVELSPDERERLITWMDANALFYGTFDPADQALQQHGERIDGPGLE
jgi:hypothetical protein